MKRRKQNHRKKKKRVGSSLDDFLEEDGTYAGTVRAIKRVIAHELDALLADQGLTRPELAKRMRMSRAQLDRILDPASGLVTLDTLTRVAKAVGRRLRKELD